MYLLVFLSFIACSYHLWVEGRTIGSWLVAQSISQVNMEVQIKALQYSCWAIFFIYAFIVGFYLFLPNDVSRILLLGAQGAVIFNSALHFVLKFVVPRKMPGFYSSCFILLPTAIAIIFQASNDWWFSLVLKLEIILSGVLVQVFLPFVLIHFITLYLLKKSNQINVLDSDSDEDF